MKLNKEIDDLYERWLLDEYSDEIHNKDDLIKAVENGTYAEIFIEKIKGCLE